MKCSFEIPTKYIKQLKEHQDYDFTLAHMVLKSEEYRTSYSAGNVMDNGYYELGEPLELRDLKRAASLCKPRVIIAPDWQDDAKKTVQAYRDACIYLDAEVAGVVVGKDATEMLDTYMQYLHLDTEIICLPFRLPRVAFLQLARDKGCLNNERWYHFLGLRSMDELKFLKSFNLEHTSIDTTKPIKAAIFDKTIHDDLRNLGRLNLDYELDAAAVERCRFNMIRFREEAQA